jgi:lipopolysaccharide transport system ATP-binding protein
MSDIAIRIEHVSKHYRIGAKIRHDTLRDQLMYGLTSMFGRKTRSFGGDEEPCLRGLGMSERPDNFWALKDISFDVKHGEVLGIIGSNGAGKSTLLKILSRITEPSRGRVEIQGRVSSLLEVGTGFHPELTGRENVYLNGAILGMKKAEIARKFDEIVAFAEVEKFIDTAVKRYSSGMLVRLAFAVAAHLEPEILIIDEVLAVGDTAFQKKCLGVMKDVSRAGRTVLFVSHNLTAVENLCQRAFMLCEGKVSFSGTSRETVDHYLQSVSGNGRITRSHAIDLADAKGRLQKYTPLLKRLALYCEGNQPFSGYVKMGGSLKAHITFELREPTWKFDACLAFDNLAGQRLFVAHTLFQPHRPKQVCQGNVTLVCEIQTLPFLPGDYKITVSHAVDRVEVDCIEDAVHFTVIESDYYGTGIAPWDGHMVLKQHWYLKD